MTILRSNFHWFSTFSSKKMLIQSIFFKERICAITLKCQVNGAILKNPNRFHGVKKESIHNLTLFSPCHSTRLPAKMICRYIKERNKGWRQQKSGFVVFVVLASSRYNSKAIIYQHYFECVAHWLHLKYPNNNNPSSHSIRNKVDQKNDLSNMCEWRKQGKPSTFKLQFVGPKLNLKLNRHCFWLKKDNENVSQKL